MKTLLISLALTAAFIFPTVASAGTILHADLNPAIEQMLIDKGIEITNARNLEVRGQVIDSPLSTDRAESLADLVICQR